MGQDEILAELRVIITAQAENFRQELNRVRSQTDSATKSVKSSTAGMGNALGAFKKYVAAAFSVAAIVKFGKACVGLGEDFNGLVRLTDATFGRASKAIQEFAETSASSFGLSQKQVYQYASDFGTSMRKIGLVGEDVSEMTLELTKRSADLGSIFNKDTNTVFSKLSAGVNGSAGALSDLGINMTEANLQAYAFRNGYAKLYDVMTETEKTMVRYNYILDQTTSAEGDFARASDTWNGQMKIFNANLENIKTNLGQGLINALTPVLKIINELMGRLASLAAMFKQFTVSMFGDASAVEATGDISDNLSTATNNAKLLKNALMGFDELNVLTTPDNWTSDSAGLSNYSSAYDEIDNTFDYIRKMIENGDWEGLGAMIIKRMFDTSKIIEFIDEIFNIDISKYTSVFGELISGMLQELGIDKEKAREIGGEVKALLDTIWTKTKEIWDKVKPILDKLKELLKDIFKFLSEKFGKGVLVDLKTQTSILGEFTKSQLDVIMGVLEIIHGFLTGDMTEVITGFIDVISGVVKGTITLLYSAKELVISAVGAIAELIAQFIGQKVSALLTDIAEMFHGMAEATGWEWAENWANSLDTSAEKAAKWGEDVGGYFDDVKEGIQQDCDDAISAVDNAAEAAKDLVSGMTKEQREAIEKLGLEVVSEYENMFKDTRVSELAKKSGEAIKRGFEEGVSGMADCVYQELKKGLTKSYTLNSVVATTTTASGAIIQTVTTTAYANGGYPEQGTMFVAGEVPGQAEMVGNINGRTGVASGAEITGIADAVYSTGGRQEEILNAIYTELLHKNLVISPSAGLGKVVSQSAAMYKVVTG